jgi:pyridoxamine 5'-phosphate oxidase
MDIKNLRLNYKKSTIDFSNLEDNPIQFFMNWFNDALEVNKDEANACVLSTISNENKPDSRVVLLKAVNENG